MAFLQFGSGTAMARKLTSTDGKIEKRVLIKASPGLIYKALTDARELTRWFCDRASCDPREGGELIAHWKTGKSGRKGRAVFTRISALSEIELHWVDDGQGETPDGIRHILRYNLRSGHENTEVRMRDEGCPFPDEESLEFVDSGWNSVLMELKDYCERKERLAKHQSSGKS